MTAASSRPPSDDEDVWICASFGIGYQHARVTPESLTETQPLVSLSQTVICFDGRLDNREELARFGSPRTAEAAPVLSDAALALAAYEQIGDRCASQLNGDFAFALFDSARQQLLLARDVMAAQCLYYCPLPGGVLFATEIKSILADPRVSASPDEDGLAELVLDDWCDEHRTCFKGIYSVPPGHLLVATRDRLVLREHWAFDPAQQIRYRSFAEYSECFRSLFEQSVRRRLRSAHPVAVAVSGGVDSSAILCQASTLVRRESLPLTLHGVAMTFPAGTPAGEQEFLQEIETACAVPIARLPISTLRLFAHDNALVRHSEMPGVVWQADHDVLAQARRLGCRVLLNGFFGDQMLFDRGYLVDLARRGRWLQVRHDLREFAAWMTDVEPGVFGRELRSRLIRTLPPRWLFRFVKRSVGRWKANRRYPAWFGKAFRERALAFHSARFETSHRFASCHAEQYYRHATAGHYVSNVRYLNAAGLMHGVDVRYPFRDRDLVAFLMAIPGDVVNWQGVPKGLLRHALSGVLPEAIRNRRWKADFTAAYNQGARDAHANVARLLSRDCLSVRAGFVDGGVIQESLGQFETTLAHDDSAMSTRQLIGLAGLELWMRYFWAERERLCGILHDPPTGDGPITPRTIALAREEGVHLLLAERLHPPELDDERRAAAVIGAARESELRTVLQALAQAAVRPILIKGCALAYTHYARPELRPREDTDVMIRADDRKTVARVLASLGYERPPEADGELTTGQFHFVKGDRCGISHALDVHWRISNVRVFADALTYEELARDARPIPALGLHARGASPRHALLAACLHRVAHHADSPNLLWLYDIHLLARGDESESTAFAALASAGGMREVCASGLMRAAAAFGGIEPHWIAAVSASIDRGGAAVDVEPSAAFLRGQQSLAGILQSDLAATPDWLRRLRILREHLFPNRPFMYARYGTHQPAALPFLYVHRIITGAPKWFRR